MFTTTNNNSSVVVIGLDHGFGQMKTAHTCFKTGVTAHDKEPAFKSDLLMRKQRPASLPANSSWRCLSSWNKTSGSSC